MYAIVYYTQGTSSTPHKYLRILQTQMVLIETRFSFSKNWLSRLNVFIRKNIMMEFLL